jgi:hypothetical protein
MKMACYSPDTTKCSLIMRNDSGPTLISRLSEGRSVTLEAPNRTGPRKLPFVEPYRGKVSDVYDTATNGVQPSTYENAGRVPNLATSQYPVVAHKGSPTRTNECRGQRVSYTASLSSLR